LPFTATAYCTGRVTASGATVSTGVVAADPAVLPIGTVIRISGAEGYDGSYRVLDTGPRVRNRHVDLYVPDCSAARRFGRRSVQVTVVDKGR
jgi:rare lipoprotein A